MATVFRKITSKNLYINWKYTLPMQLEKRNIKASHGKINFISIKSKGAERLVELSKMFLLKQMITHHIEVWMEFSSYEIELRNRVMQNDITLRVTNSKIFIEILLSSY